MIFILASCGGTSNGGGNNGGGDTTIVDTTITDTTVIDTTIIDTTGTDTTGNDSVLTGPVDNNIMQTLKVHPLTENVGGYETTGGRGGQVYLITTLNDNASGRAIRGSFREFIEASGPRIAVFNGISGVIELQRILKAGSGDFSIYGQSSPGGIAIKNGSLIVEAGNWNIQYISFLPGPSTFQSTNDLDAFRGNNGRTVQNNITHGFLYKSNFGWGTDENLSFWPTIDYLTVERCLIAEGLYRAGHPSSNGIHSMGMLLSQSDGGDNSTFINISRSGFANNNRRSPKIFATNSQLFCNVVYNFGDAGTEVSSKTAKSEIDVVGNVYLRGPNTRNAPFITTREQVGNPISLFLADNFSRENYQGGNINNVTVSSTFLSDRPFVLRTSAVDPEAVLDDVISNFGPSRPYYRDEFADRIADQIRNNTGRFIDHPDEVGGWPRYLTDYEAYQDFDQDGMPDDWEIVNGYDPSRDDSSEDEDGDGFTNIEEIMFLMETHNPFER